MANPEAAGFDERGGKGACNTSGGVRPLKAVAGCCFVPDNTKCLERDCRTATSPRTLAMLRFQISDKRERQQLDHVSGPIEFGRGPKRNQIARCVIEDLRVSR